MAISYCLLDISANTHYYMTLQIPVKCLLFHRSLQTEPDQRQTSDNLALPLRQVGQFKLIDLRGLKLTSKLFKIAGCWRAVSPAH